MESQGEGCGSDNTNAVTESVEGTSRQHAAIKMDVDSSDKTEEENSNGASALESESAGNIEVDPGKKPVETASSSDEKLAKQDSTDVDPEKKARILKRQYETGMAPIKQEWVCD